MEASSTRGNMSVIICVNVGSARIASPTSVVTITYASCNQQRPPGSSSTSICERFYVHIQVTCKLKYTLEPFSNALVSVTSCISDGSLLLAAEMTLSKFSSYFWLLKPAYATSCRILFRRRNLQMSPMFTCRDWKILQNRLPAWVNFIAAMLPCASKTGLRHTIKSASQHENVQRGYVASNITTHVQNGVRLHVHKPRNIVSCCPFVNRFIDNCLLCTRLDHSQAVVFFLQIFKNNVQSGLLPFFCKFFHSPICCSKISIRCKWLSLK